MNRKLLAFIIALLIGSASYAQVAAISASPTSGCAPLPVLFDDASTGATSWAWDFGDLGAKSTLQHPGLHTYLLPGIYTATLTINGTITAKQTITVNAIPTVLFTVDKNSGCFPLTVNFTDQSVPLPGTTTTAWSWDFGDGSPFSNLKNPTHIYTQLNPPGFPVTLKITNSAGCSNALTIKSMVMTPSGVTPSFQTVAAAGCKLPITVQFNNTSTGPGTLTYTWSFGDASATTNTTSPGHTYTAPDIYNVKLIASSTSGCIDSVTVPTNITSGNVSSSFSIPDTVCVGTLVNFLNTSSPKPTVVNWDFGDGTSSSALGPTKRYSTPNVYTVKLTNTFGACIDSVSRKLTVLTPAVANFTAATTTSCDSIFTVQFTDQSANAGSWSWNFGDGTISNQQNPSHTYKGYGQYSVSLTVSNSVGCSGSITKTQFIQNRKPFVQLNGLASKGCLGAFTYSPQLIDTVVDGIQSYLWNFGDGTTSTAATPPAHSYPATGVYFVTLNITTNGGCTVTANDTVKIGTVKPVVNFTASPTTVCTNNPVTFVDKSTNSPDQWYWDFGNGSSSTQQNPVYIFPTPGTYTVTLIAYNGGCNDSSKTKIIVSPPQAAFAYTYSCSGNNTVFDFHDSSKGADTWNWDFGDGSVSTAQNPSHIYAVADASYTVVLTVTNNTTHCTNSNTQQVFIVHQKPTLYIPSANTCVNTKVSVQVTGVSFSYFSSFTFIYGDGDTVNAGFNSNGSHIYKQAGKYNVTVIATEITGCKDTITQLNAIQVNGPTANFTTTVSTGCTGLAAVFVDQSATDGINPITKWVWDYGDSTPIQTYTAPPFTHNYTKQGIYSVKLKVTDASGCTDSLSQINLITVAFPNASFTTTDSLTCPGSPIQFVNNSKGYGLNYTWDFGDGSTSTAANPTHLYAPTTYPMTYTVSLQVSDQFGCGASTGNYKIGVDTPSASFTLSSTFASCPPLVDSFDFTGHYAKTLKWVFGDGGISGLDSPVHYYNIPGTYSPYLVVTSHGGCTSTAPAQNVKILGPYGALSYSPLQGCHTLTVNFNVITGNVVKYLWVFSNTQTDSTLVPNISFTYDSIGKYLPIVVLEDPSGCNVPIYGSDSIVIIGSTPKFSVDKDTLCSNGSVQFSDSTTSVGTIQTYQWNFGDGTTSNLENPAHFYSAPGSYSVSLIVTTTTGCSDTSKQNTVVNVVAAPSIDIGGATSQCVPATISFTGIALVADPSLTWSWNFYNGQTSAVQNPPAQVYTTPGSDSVLLKATNSSGCSDSVTKYFTINPSPGISAGADTTVCVGQSVTLIATGGLSYNWLPPNGTLSCITCDSTVATPTTTTTYVVSGTSIYNCVQNDTVVVNVITPQSISVTPLTDSICLGQGVPLLASGETLYTWTPATGLSNPNIANPVASPDSTTTYQVTGTDIKSCFSDTKSLTISVFNYPKIDVGPNVTLPIGTSYQITGNGSSDIDSISWTPTIGLSCTDCLSPLASPITTTTYVISVENTGGCVSTDSVTILVTCDGKNLFVPNTFSPNGDGVNDAFFVSGNGLSTIQSMRVFNRWGQMVFEKRNFAPNDPNVGWDGNFNGRKAPVDVYIYTIEVICENSQVVAYHGNVALIR